MIIKKFCNIVNRYKNKVAIVESEASITYGELYKDSIMQAKKLVETINQNNLYTDKRIGLLLKQGIEGITGITACMWLNLTYVPIDIQYPENFLIEIFKDAGIRCMIVTDSMVEKIKIIVEKNSLDISIINYNSVVAYDINSYFNLLDQNNSNDIMYIVYTSGSTGIPKGVMQRQDAVLYFVKEYRTKIKLTSKDRMTLFSSFCHDASILDTFAGLLTGATLYTLDLKKPDNMIRLSTWLIKNRITIWHSVPSVFRAIQQFVKKSTANSLRCIILGGEMVRESDARNVKKLGNSIQLYNLYGQTEASFNGGTFVENENDVKVIKQICNDTRFIIANGDHTYQIVSNERILRNCYLEELEQWDIQKGELIISSYYVALGYLHREELTKQRFTTLTGLGKIYRTGDYVELEQNSIKYKGRIDNQYKIRGYRVELSGIENILLQMEDVRECTVIAKAVNASYYLYAFLITDKKISVVEVNEWIAGNLPSYMLLHDVILMDSLPYTLTGKVDRNKLLGEIVDKPESVV